MPTYVFKAMDLAGVPAQGEVDAVSKQDVADQLKQRGLVVVDIANKYRSRELNIELFARVKPAELAVATRQLSTMVTSGMAILRALQVLEAQTKSKLLQETLAVVRHDVEAGLLLSDALERHPKVFNPLYVAMVRAGEAGGVLDASLRRTADQLEKDASLRRQVRAATIYPALVISFAVVVLIALVAFLIPVFESVFKQFGGKLPTLTQFMVGLSHLIRDQWYILIVGVAARRVRLLQVEEVEVGAPEWDAFKLRIPLKIGDVVQKVAIARWSRTLSSLTSAGVPIMQALDITGKTAGNAVIERSMGEVIASVKTGGTISEPLRARVRVPADGLPHGRRGRGDRRARRDAVQARRVLRGRGGRRDQGADLDPRARDDHPCRRHRRRDRRLDVPAAVRRLQPDQVSAIARRGLWSRR